MAEYVSLHRGPTNEYLLKVSMAGVEVDVVLDTGFTDPDCQTGLALDRESYRRIRNQLSPLERIEALAVDGRLFYVESGFAPASIVGLDGSEVVTRVAEVGANLVGVCYFHQLHGFEMAWDFDSGEMTIRRKL